MRGFIAAQQLGVVDEYVTVTLSAMWEQEQNMGDPGGDGCVAVSGAGCRGVG